MYSFRVKHVFQLLSILFVVQILHPQFITAMPQAAGGSANALRPCQILTQEVAESILGPVEAPNQDTDFQCSYPQRGSMASGGKKRVMLQIRRSATPQHLDLARERADIENFPGVPVTVTDVPNFGDAAFWSWMPGWGALDAYKGGTVHAKVIVGDIPQDQALFYAKKVAALALGGAGRSAQPRVAVASTGDAGTAPAAGANPGKIVPVPGVEPERPSGPRVGADVCNAGQIAFDTFVVRHGIAASVHLAPRDCAHVYEGNNSVPAYLGFGFADSHGKWAPAARVDEVRFYYVLTNEGPHGVWDLVSQSFPVKHGNTTVSIPTPLRFDAPHATCITTEVDVTPPQPLALTPAERHRQESDRRYETRTSCESFRYVINGAADPETREVEFKRLCEVCVIGAPPADLAERKQRTQQAIQTMSQISPMAGGLMGAINAQIEKNAAIEERGLGTTQPDHEPGYTLMSWGDLDRALNAVHPGGSRPAEVPELMMVRGTVSRVEVSTPSAQQTEVDVYFREMPDQRKFTACAQSADAFEELFGPDFRTRMVGQVIQAQGVYIPAGCKGNKGSLRLSIAGGLRNMGR